VNLYAESSAVLAWLLDEQTAPAVRRLLGEAEVIVASDLTLIECDRVLLRVVALKELTEAEAADRRAHLIAAAAHWHVLRIAAEIVDRARQPWRRPLGGAAAGRRRIDVGAARGRRRRN
jgi:uncharacterized protein with PIN domain